MEALQTYALDKFRCHDSKAKSLYYARASLTYLAKTKLDARYESFRLFLELPKAVKTRKLVTGRIVTIEDVQNVLAFLKVRYAGHSDRANHALRITIRSNSYPETPSIFHHTS